MKVFKLAVNDELVSLLQRISFELEGQKRIIKELILENQDNPEFINNQAFITFNKRYEEKFAEYETAKADLQDKFIPKELLVKASLTNWELDYNTSVMTITYAGSEFDNISEEEIKVMFNAKEGEKV